MSHARLALISAAFAGLSMGCPPKLPKARSPSPEQGPASTPPPRLIVQLTVDQLRTDLLSRYVDRYVEGGLARFLNDGIFYERARYHHAITETAVGHATLFTGALPSVHGIVGNEWFERGEKRSSVEDPRFPLLGTERKVTEGASPAALRVSTLGDQLKLATFGHARVFGVSLKDRAAILPAGHAGKAFWYDESNGRFITSRYYYPDTPEWLRAWEAARPQDHFPSAWHLLLPQDSYARRAHDARGFERGVDGQPSFPHALSTAPDTRYKALKHSPFGDELLVQLVEALLAAEPLGADEIPDLLAISFSATDIVGHAYGPESLEAEDNLLRLDRVVARLFELLLARVPRHRLVVVLSGDHGISESPEHLSSLGLPAGRLPSRKDLIQGFNDELVQRWGEAATFVQGFTNPCLWLDEAKIAARGLALEEVERFLAQVALSRDGVAYAFARSDVMHHRLPDNEIERLVQASFDYQRTGNVYLVPKPGWILATDPEDLTAMHGTPYVFDRSVPIAFWGLGLAAQRIQRDTDPRDIAVTLSELARVGPPTGSSGQPLTEVTRATPPQGLRLPRAK